MSMTIHPHFHVRGSNSDGQVRIDNLLPMNGKIDPRDYIDAFIWANDNRGLLRQKWNEYNERD
jgi:hypothetical protein